MTRIRIFNEWKYKNNIIYIYFTERIKNKNYQKVVEFNKKDLPEIKYRDDITKLVDKILPVLGIKKRDN